MYSMSVTSPTFQFEMSELKLDAPSNMPCMLVTALTSQFEMSELKLDAPRNMYCMSVTCLTHQVPIKPNRERVAQVILVVSHPSLM
jgi:hypothetical protein